MTALTSIDLPGGPVFREDLGLWMPPYDLHFTKETFELGQLGVILPLVNRYTVAVDIGAHVGSWSVALTGVFDEVLSFEPDRENFACLTRNLETRARGSWSARRCALADARGMVSMRCNSHGNSGALQVCEDEGDVPMLRLDDLIEPNTDVGLIKIDTEGFEPLVLFGAERVIRESRPVVVLEQTPGCAVTGLRPTAGQRMLEWWGYRLRVALGKNFVMVPMEDDNDGVQEEAQEGPGILICR